MVGRPRLYSSTAEKQKAYRNRKKEAKKRVVQARVDAARDYMRKQGAI